MKAESRERAINRLILAYTILSTIPGIPTIFYGDEAGLEGYRDPFNRMPFPWGKEEQRLIDHYRTMGNIRNNNDIYKAGDFKINYLDNDLLIFERYNEEYSYITIINNSDKDLVASFEELAHDLITDISADKFNVCAYSGHIFKTKRKTTIEI
jgi:glycosidase